MVSPKFKTGAERNVAFHVAVVDSDCKTVIDERISWDPLEIKSLVTFITMLKNKKELLIGKPIEVVREIVKSYIIGKKVIDFNATNDFLSLGLRDGDFNVLDVGDHFFSDNKDVAGNIIQQPISLRRVVHYNFNLDIQSSTHSPTVD